jgi:acetyl-CoA acetyltransferase
MQMDRDQAAIVGVGATPYYRRGQSWPQTVPELAVKAILAAADDAGLDPAEIDGFSYFAGGLHSGLLAEMLGIPEVRFSATQTAGGSGSAGSVGLAAAAIAAKQASVVVSLISVQQARRRLGATYSDRTGPEGDFTRPYGAFAPGHFYSLMTRRHMDKYGTTREHLAEVCIAEREHAIRRPTSLFQHPLTVDDYFSSRMISDPLCLFDYTMESDGAVAVITTDVARARSLRHPPVYVMGAAQGGDGRWGRGYVWLGMSDDLVTTAGAGAVARRLYGEAGITPDDVDVALFYDHFSPMVLMQLEDFGFCPPGMSGPFVAEGNIRWPAGKIPVNTHGGNLSEAYIIGMTHFIEAVEQLRGVAINQVQDAEIALVTGGPSHIPVSAVLLRR